MASKKLMKAGLAGASFVALTALLAGCASGDTPEADVSEVAVDEAAVALLPQEIADAGTLTVGTEAYYPPYEYLDSDGATVIGLDMDLIKAVGQKLGLEVTIENVAFDTLLPSLDTARYDVVVAAMTDTPERQENYDFVDYFNAGQGIVVAEGNPEGISAEADLCGKAVSVLRDSAQQGILEAFNTDICSSSPIEISAQATDNDALIQVQSGRAVASVSQYPVASYNVEQAGGFELANEEPFQPEPLGMAVAKDNELSAAIQAALQSLIDDGTYTEILAAHGQEGGAVTEVVINGAE